MLPIFPIFLACYALMMITFIGGFAFMAYEQFSEWRDAKRAEMESQKAIDAAQFRRDAAMRDFFNA